MRIVPLGQLTAGEENTMSYVKVNLSLKNDAPAILFGVALGAVFFAVLVAIAGSAFHMS